jgi:hypothetical protein
MRYRLTTAPARLAIRDTRAIKPPEKATDPIYLSREWKTLVVRLIRERGRACEQCGRTHEPDGRPVRIYGDHIRELRDGGPPFDPANIRLLDGGCHNQKTAAERARRLAERF